MPRLKMICEAAAKSRRTATDSSTKAVVETYVCEAEFQAAPDAEENRAFFPTQQGAFLRLQNYLDRIRFRALIFLDIHPVKDAPPAAGEARRLRFLCHHGKLRRLQQTTPDGQKIDVAACDAEFAPVPNAEENRALFFNPGSAFLKLVACGPEFEGGDEYFVDITPAPATAPTPAQPPPPEAKPA